MKVTKISQKMENKSLLSIEKKILQNEKMLFFSEMSIYRRYSNKNKCMYFLTKDENLFDIDMTTLEKISNMIKAFNSELIYNKK